MGVGGRVARRNRESWGQRIYPCAGKPSPQKEYREKKKNGERRDNSRAFHGVHIPSPLTPHTRTARLLLFVDHDQLAASGRVAGAPAADPHDARVRAGAAPRRRRLRRVRGVRQDGRRTERRWAPLTRPGAGERGVGCLAQGVNRKKKQRRGGRTQPLQPTHRRLPFFFSMHAVCVQTRACPHPRTPLL